MKSSFLLLLSGDAYLTLVVLSHFSVLTVKCFCILAGEGGKNKAGRLHFGANMI